MSAGQVRCFEDLTAWQKARKLNREIDRHTNSGEFARDSGLRDQIRRAFVSISSKIAAGFDRTSTADFRRFVAIARASCAEVQSQLCLVLDIDHLDQRQFDSPMGMAREVSRILGGLRTS